MLEKYEDLLQDFMEIIDDYDNEILIKGYDLTKLIENLKKVEA